MKSFRWILFLLLVGWNLWFLMYLFLQMMFLWYTICHFEKTILLKNFGSSPLAKRANLSVPWWWKTRTFCNMPGVAKRPWSALCVVARSLSLRWIADGSTTMQGGLSCWTRWEYDPGQFLEDRNGNPQELYWQQFFCWHLLSSQVEEVENARCPTWSREKSDESTTDIYHFSCWSSISEMSWAVKKPCLFSVYGVDVTTQFIQKVWYATTRIWTHHYNGKSFPDFDFFPHLFMMAVSPLPMLFTAFSPRWKAHRYHSIPSLVESLEFPVLYFGGRGERRRYKVHSTIQKVEKTPVGLKVSTAKMPVSFQISKMVSKLPFSSRCGLNGCSCHGGGLKRRSEGKGWNTSGMDFSREFIATKPPRSPEKVV